MPYRLPRDRRVEGRPADQDSPNRPSLRESTYRGRAGAAAITVSRRVATIRNRRFLFVETRELRVRVNI